MNKNSEEIMTYVSGVTTECTKSYIGYPVLTVDSLATIKKQIDAWNTITSPIIMNRWNYNVLMGIPNKTKYICC
jgi:hypothetical protein